MSIRDALWVLERAHTRDDAQVGYRVETLPQVFEHSRAEYIEAWGVVRDHLRHGDGTCNICGGPLHMGCCNPNRPEQAQYNWKQTAFEVDERGVGNIVTREVAPMALTDRSLAVMEAWIRKRGYAPFTNAGTGETVILCTECRQEECRCPIPF